MQRKIIQLADELTDQIQQHADAKTKAWFDNYLKGAIAYRGVKTPEVTKLVKEWRDRNNLKQYSTEEQLSICETLISGEFAEDKFAGTIYLQKFLLSHLNYQAIVELSDLLFDRGNFFDWSTTDWYCTRILDPTIIKHGMDAAEAIANGRFSLNLWRRRAAIVPFRHASKDEQYHSLITTIISDLLPSDERFIQTGVGWVLSDMSKSYPKKAESLFREHLRFFSKEVITRHTKYLDSHRELKALKQNI